MSSSALEISVLSHCLWKSEGQGGLQPLASSSWVCRAEGRPYGVMGPRESSLEISVALVNAPFVIFQSKNIGGWGLRTGLFASVLSVKYGQCE